MWHTSSLNVSVLCLCMIVFFSGISVGFDNISKARKQAAITAKPLVYGAHEISELLKYLIVYVRISTERELLDIPDEFVPLDPQRLEDIARNLLDALEKSVRDFRKKILEFISSKRINADTEKMAKKLQNLYESSDETKETRNRATGCSSKWNSELAGCQTESKSYEKDNSNAESCNTIEYLSDNSLDEKEADVVDQEAEDKLVDYDVGVDRSGIVVEPRKRPSNISPIGERGQDFPTFTNIPKTQFSCDFIDFIPGFYADLETGCQVFHVCWPRRRESFLCPIGTTFNQKILSCDYWYNSDCTQSPDYFYLNEDLEYSKEHELDDSLYTQIVDGDYSTKHFYNTLSLTKRDMKFTPIQFTTLYYAGRPLHPDTPEFEKFDEEFPEHDDSYSISEEEFNAIIRKIYDKLFPSTKNQREKYDALIEPWVVSEFLLNDGKGNKDSKS